MKWAEGRALRKQNWKLPAKKNEYTCENNISWIYSETLRKFRRTNQKNVSNQLDTKLGQFTIEED